jgi:hypothetical protein
LLGVAELSRTNGMPEARTTLSKLILDLLLAGVGTALILEAALPTPSAVTVLRKDLREMIFDLMDEGQS